MEEARSINKSISALGNCINALIFPKRYKHVPYRDSKLTRILSAGLGGNSHTTLVACISPSLIQYDETLSTLLYAQGAQSVNTFAIVNEEVKIQTIRVPKPQAELDINLDVGLDGRWLMLQSENHELRTQILELQRRRNSPPEGSSLTSRTLGKRENGYPMSRRAKSTIGNDGPRRIDDGRQGKG
jgi:hypothetical protein